MANYSYSVTGQTNDNAGIVGIHHVASPATRPKIYEFVIGGDDDAANACDYRVTYHTSMLTGACTAKTPAKLDPDSVAADAQGFFGGTVAGTDLMEFGLNQRVSFRWVARQGKEFVFGATANHNIHISGGNITTAFDVSATIFFEE